MGSLFKVVTTMIVLSSSSLARVPTDSYRTANPREFSFGFQTTKLGGAATATGADFIHIYFSNRAPYWNFLLSLVVPSKVEI
jgi:hypothetical protein